MKNIDIILNKIYPGVVKIRRRLHRNPELTGQEFKTAAFIHSQLSVLGLKPKYYAAKRGVAAKLENGGGKTVVLRADCDALPIREKNAIAFQSKNTGVMHACGHDMHMASLLGAAQAMAALRGRIKGTLVFLFQPAEETEPGGALQMIKEGAFPKHVDAVFAQHVCPDLPAGTIGLVEGFDCANVTDFDIMVTGKGGHGAAPQDCIDSLLCACALVTSLQSLISRDCPPHEAAVITIGEFHAGTARNVISDVAELKGTLRTYTEIVRAKLLKRLNVLCKETAAAYGASAKLIIRHGYPAVYNNPILVQRISSGLMRGFGARAIRTIKPSLFGEDFAYYQRKTAGVLLHAGVGNPGKKSAAPLHSPVFLPYEPALKTMLKVHVLLALEMLAQSAGDS